MQRLVINFTGNTRGKYKNKRTTSWIDVDNQLLSKRKKQLHIGNIYILKEINFHKN